MPDHPLAADFEAAAKRLVDAALEAAIDELLAQSSPPDRDITLMPAMNLVCSRLGAKLTRWVGADGWNALLRRGLDDLLRAGVTSGVVQGANGELFRLDAASPIQVREGCVQVLVAVARVLARFVGDDMGLRLIEQGMTRDDIANGKGPDHG